MNKNKLLAVGIILFLLVLPFRFAYITFTTKSELLQVLSMAFVIFASAFAIYLYNKGAEESNHHWLRSYIKQKKVLY